MTDEIWKDIPGWPYQVSSLGRVRRVHIVSPIKTQKTYHRIQLSRGRDGRKRTTATERAFFVHRLVAEAFLGPCPEGKSHVAHKDGNPLNNAPDNLYWATPLENAADRKRHFLTYFRSRHFASSVTDENVLLIRAWFHIGDETITRLSKMFGYSDCVIRNIVRNRTFRTVGGYV